MAVHHHCYIIRSSVNAVCSSYYMQTAAYLAAKDTHIARTKVKTLLPDRLPVFVPPPDVQARVVSLLDGFHSPVNDLYLGLPAENRSRRPQYDCYRDKLLSFEEAV